MERVVKVTVDAMGGVLPKTPQYAGVQGEHNACRVSFDVAAWENEPFIYRGEFVGGDGTGGTTAVLTAEEGCVSFLLPAAWTAAGGRAVARLVASVTVDGEELQTVYAVDVPLYFAAKQEYGTAVREEAYEGLTALAEAVQTAVDTVEEKLADGSLVGPRGPEGKQGVSGVYVGGGEMPEGYNVQIDPDGEASMSLAIGKVETLAEGEAATASIGGTAEAPVLNLGLPRGERGETAVLNAFELIASGETDSEKNSVVITQDNEGNPFFLRDMITIYMYAPKAAQTASLSISFNGTLLHQIANGVKEDSERYSRAVCVYSGKKWDCYAYVVDNVSMNGNLASRDRFGRTDEHIVNEIKLHIYTAGQVLPAGFKYEVYGRRA